MARARGYARRARVPGYKMHRYDNQWHEAIFPVTGDNI
jgi:hypothetical protein